MTKDIIIEGKGNRLTINGTEITFPIHYNTLVELFGEPSQQTYSEIAWYVVWDEIGLNCSYGSWDNILRIHFFQSEHTKVKFPPKKLFAGMLLVDDKNFTTADFDTIEFGKTSIRRTVYEKGGAPVGFYIGKNYNYKEKIPKDKYAIIQPQGPIIQFKDLNLKLCIIEELMYTQELIAPKFDLYEFAEWYQERKIDIEEEGYDFIPEVTQYFKELSIEKKHAALITELFQDGGNDIYLNMLRFGGGDVDVFDIESAADAIHFPNLKKVTLCYAKEPVLDEFKEMGIEAEWL